MVTVFLRGGLGNQMFQYAAGLGIAERNNASLLLDAVFLNDRFPRRQFAYRTYDLGVFELDQRLTTLSRISSTFPIPGVWLACDLALVKGKTIFGAQTILRERREHEVDPAVARASGDVILWGRWQNEKYFQNVEQQLRSAFRFRQPLAGAAEHIANEIVATSAVSLHVRRGDYAAFKGVEALHGKTDLAYYERGVRYISERVHNPHFFIFSDDIAWCRENLHLNVPATYVPSEAAGPHDAFHLQLMSLCDHHIITNSTFSWWGAWLDPRPEKIVVAPKRWYNDREEQPDIIPAGWMLL